MTLLKMEHLIRELVRKYLFLYGVNRNVAIISYTVYQFKIHQVTS